MTKKVILSLSLILILAGVQVVLAQYTDPWYSSYQVQNLSDSAANITVTYYDSAGAAQTTATQNYTNVPGGGSVTVVQYSDDPNLGTGTYSAVISSDQPIAAIANQQLVPTGATYFNPTQPFSSYSGASSGSTTVIIPVAMYNWFGYYTEFYIQNVGTAAASDVDIAYYPTKVGTVTVGATGITDNDNAIPQYASLNTSQEAATTLGAPASAGAFAGRFMGAAVITSDQPLVVIVNQHVPGATKLFTYNGFGAGFTNSGTPVYMRGFYGYYASLTVANTSLSASANVTLTYQADSVHSTVAGGTVVVPYTIPAGESINRFDGPTGSADQTDLDAYTRFFGTVTIEADQSVVAIVNQEATADGQAGTYGSIDLDSATTKISVPLIQSGFYGYYTSLTIMSATGASGTCDVTYTSDGVNSSVKNASKTYPHTITAAPLNVYEGTTGALAGDINTDTFWLDGTQRFIGSAIIECTVPVVAFVNSEKDVTGADSMYTFNTFSLTP